VKKQLWGRRIALAAPACLYLFSMDTNQINGHKEGATSATDTLTGATCAGMALMGIRIFLGHKGITLSEGELLTVGAAITGVFTGVSSYIHGYFRGKK
jgi:hypothetical protein